MTDLFDLEQQVPRNHGRKEAAVLVEVLKALNARPVASWYERTNSGAARMGAGPVHIGLKEPIGQLRSKSGDGHFLRIAAKD